MIPASPLRRGLVALLASLAALPVAHAQAPFPTRSVTIVVPFPPRGARGVTSPAAGG